jgi:hypothetical protein
MKAIRAIGFSDGLLAVRLVDRLWLEAALTVATAAGSIKGKNAFSKHISRA